jgi:hypothetical protein
VAGLLFPHAFEHLGGGGIVFAKSIGVIAVDPLVFFFEGDGEGENLTFGEAIEAAHSYIVIQEAPTVLASQQMAFVDLTKQLAKEAFLSATKDPPAPAATPSQADNTGAVIFGQIHGLQKALKDDEELVVWFANAGEKLRVMEIFLPSPKVAVLSGHDAERNLTRVISPVDALQLVVKVMKVAPGAKALRVGLVMPKTKDSSA